MVRRTPFTRWVHYSLKYIALSCLFDDFANDYIFCESVFMYNFGWTGYLNRTSPPLYATPIYIIFSSVVWPSGFIALWQATSRHALQSMHGRHTSPRWDGNKIARLTAQTVLYGACFRRFVSVCLRGINTSGLLLYRWHKFQQIC